MLNSKYLVLLPDRRFAGHLVSLRHLQSHFARLDNEAGIDKKDKRNLLDQQDAFQRARALQGRFSQRPLSVAGAVATWLEMRFLKLHSGRTREQSHRFTF